MRAAPPRRPPPMLLLLSLLLPLSPLWMPAGAEPEDPEPSPSPDPSGAVFAARPGDPVFLPGPAPTPGVRAVRGWSVLAGACPPPAPARVCLDGHQCFADVALDAACLRTARVAPLAVAELAARADAAGDRELSLAGPRVLARLGRNETGVLIASAAEEDGGVYFLYDRRPGGEETQSALTLRVAADGTEAPSAAPTGEAPAPTPGPPRPMTTPARPRRHGARFRVLPYHSHVYTPGDSFLLSVRLQSEFFDEAPFSASVDWYFLRTAADCALVRVYETCIFHPEAPACLHPADARCSFASPYRSESMYSRLYERCRPDPAGRWSRECEGSSYEAPVAHLHPADNGVDLVFAGAPAEASGLYVFVLRYNGHVEAWDYSLVATSDRLANTVADHTRPEAAATDAPEPSPPPGGRPAGAPPAPARWPAPWLVVLGGVLALAGLTGAAALAVWGCVRRASRERTYDILNPFGAVYTSLPTSDPHEVLSSGEEDFLPDEDSSFAEDDSEDDDDAPDGGGPPAGAYDLAGAPGSPGGAHDLAGARPSRSGFKVWFRDPVEDDAAPPPQPRAAPDYTAVAARLKSILR
ncbi:envelope glycoprotein E [Cervid alphaherpesvirus 1]|uniref:Envelope glycoprotein E n=1 Tax=Cervid alphaherpesvirus 1 TaxID=79891 RepID=A0A455JNT1_9ALPH|nr:envelope glycoprotein E [Cervid alphaherpesvirus 1]AVT50720.1 envelope glycoprotein E [Cervid alphaherpesvirus 1]